MDLLPTIWAGTLSASLSVVVLALLALHFALRTGRTMRIILSAVTSLVTLVVISSGVDSIVVHGERSVLVFAAVAVGIGSLIAIVYKAIAKK